MKFAVAVALLAFLILPASAFGADKVAPKISKAVMQDRDHDGRADAVLVTFSEKVRHSADTKKPFPFAVAGYKVKRVGAAKGKTVLVKLAEKLVPDGVAHPKVTYKRTKSKPVRDRAGNQAKAGRFTGTKPFDAVPPNTAITDGPSGTVASRGATLVFSSEAFATFECKLDLGAFTPCASGQAYAALTDGAHAFQVRAIDRAGNRDPTPAERAWSVDGDGDGSLAPSDCAPDDADVHPGAADSPDSSFRDDNCDGIDGDKAEAVFVAITGSDVGGTCGAFESPCRTINFAQTRAVTLARSQVYISAGTYTGGVLLQNGLELYGGFAVDWSRSDAHPVTINGGFDAATSQYLTVKAISVTAELRDLRIVGPTASGTVNRNGRSSYGIFAQSSTLTLERLEIVGGNGSNGLAGTAGTSATQAAADAGQEGGDGDEPPTSPCDATSHGAGGPGATNNAVPAVPGVSNATGGTGGDGGALDTDCGPLSACGFGGNCNAKPGQKGFDAGLPQAGVFGVGGPGGAFKATSCETPGTSSGSNGLPGRTSDGAGGAGGTTSFLSSNFWFAESGDAGTLGLHGTGGGGGGGAAGCDDGTDAYGPGGGGGGAGGARATVVGTGGGGGGSSFGVFAVSSTILINDSDVDRGDGGDGGVGGAGGAGQPGGAAGPPGAPEGTSPAGSGGAGGRGGHSGAGGGGRGGHSYAFFSFQSTITRTLTTVLSGAVGSGGAGGTVPFVAGGPVGGGGANGTLGTVGTCASAASC